MAEPPDVEHSDREEREALPDEELRAILDEHRRWLEGDSNARPADLKGKRIRGNLDGERLDQASLIECDLCGASLKEASLYRATLIGAKLRETDLEFADLRDADLHDADLARAVLRGANLQTANLTDADLGAANLADSQLEGADFTAARLKGAKLAEASGLSECILRDANLEGATGIIGSEFARIDVTGARLPKEIHEFRVLAVVEEISANARKIFFSMLIGCAYSWLTIATTRDAGLLTNSASSPLPIIQTRVPIAEFYWWAPFLLLGLYLYLHLYLRRMWKAFAGLPARFPDGKALDERAYPWILNGVVRRHFDLLEQRSRFDVLEEWSAIALAWWFVPLTLFGFWFRYLPRHDWAGTALHVLLIAAAVWAAFGLLRNASGILRGRYEDRNRFREHLGVLLLAISLAVESAHAMRGTPLLLGLFGVDMTASLSEVDVSTRPDDFYRIPKDERLESVKAASLQGANLCGARAMGAFLVGANLRNADLSGANLEAADLRNAHLRGANLEGAHLALARLQWARLNSAILRDVNLAGADLTGAAIEGSDLSRAQLQRARFTKARLSEAILVDANLAEADLREAVGVECDQLEQAANWELALRTPDLACGEGIPSR